jgi:hypothetical protein
MVHWISAFSVIGILATAVVWGTDVFFLAVGRIALRSASSSAATEVMGFMHLYADARMPIFGAAAILSNLLLVVFSAGNQRWLYGASLLALIVFLGVYNALSRPINRLQTEAAKTGRTLANARQLQASWDRSLLLRVPLLFIALTAQCVAVLLGSARL